MRARCRARRRAGEAWRGRHAADNDGLCSSGATASGRGRAREMNRRERALRSGRESA